MLWVLDAQNYRSIEHRKRLFLALLRKDVYPEPIHPPAPSPEHLQDRFCYRADDERGIVESNAYRKPLTVNMRGYVDEARNAAIAAGESGQGFVNVGRASRYKKVQQIFPTIDAHNYGTEGTLPDGQNVVTTIREDMRAQGFPEWVDFPPAIPRGYLRNMIGDAVNVYVLRAIFRQILKPEQPIQGPQPDPESDGIRWRCPDKYCALKHAVVYEDEGEDEKSEHKARHAKLHDDWKTDVIWPWTKEMIDKEVRGRKPPTKRKREGN